MEKHSIRFNDSITVGHNAPTAINVLLGANNKIQYEDEFSKILRLNESSFPITFLTDLSLLKVKKGEELWRKVISESRFLSGTVPVYQAIDSNKKIDSNALVDIISEQAESGVKIITIHPTPTFELMKMSKNRRSPITSRGGAAVCYDMITSHKKENVYKEVLDQIIKIVNKYGTVISIGSSFRSANLYDAMDCVYRNELSAQIKIADYCTQRGVNAIIKTPGHASPQNIFKICNILKKSSPFPIMPLGPMPTDCAFELDDFAAAVGAVLMGTNSCADILSVVTNEEHTGGIPTVDSLFEALKKYSVAKHIIDIYKLGNTIDDDRVSNVRSKKSSCIYDKDRDCKRCGEICPLKLSSLLNKI